MEEPPDVETLVTGLVSDNEGARKYAVFKLQSLLGDPAFADAFIQGDGQIALRHAALETIGNTQAYAFGSLDALLELDIGWDAVDGPVIDKAVELAVTHPLVNIVRNALTLLVLIVSRPLRQSRRESAEVFGFGAIKPALDNHPDFLDSLVQRLSASDHTLCANALQLVNALMRDAVIHGGEHEWPKFIKRLQDLGVIGGVGMLMRGDAASDVGSPLATAILEFQGLTKVLLRKWKEVRVNLELVEHRRALKTINLLSKPEPYNPPQADGEDGGKDSKRHHPRKWRRLGFESENPALEFDDTGYLGMMDLVDYARRNEDSYSKILMEQAVQPVEQRCPVARASLSITLILYEHFEIDEAVDTVDGAATGHTRTTSAYDREVNPYNVNKMYRPLLLQWGRLHTAATNAFQRMWKLAAAEHEDFFKIEEVIRVIIERIIGAADRKTDVGKIEDELRGVTLETARRWQIDGLDEVYEDAWGPHLVQVREQLHQESQQFMKEQRVRCLLQGQWFPVTALNTGAVVPWRYVRLSHNRKWLHYQDFASKNSSEPTIGDLAEKIDLSSVTSVDSNVSAAENPVMNGANESTETLKETKTGDSVKTKQPQQSTTTKITILGTPNKPNKHSLNSNGGAPDDESILLELFPQTSYIASEWLDGLLMLLNQEPITKDTTRLIDMMKDWGVRLRMLNLRWEDVDWEALEARVKGARVAEREVPTREGLDEDYYYAMAEA
ncbi:hypothetical protein LTR78_004644 [Recurvomyces mirabilis]|uniref:ELMO domain-containing protein n=1 Tax=Recurvomyces mirabilis TaxID=574656 RepID=A0AAE0WPR7_9PEZI|nr:hypothetical protein LTR78_004644 [Recurvomyces mirabilis]KAK5152863.1 hypothetical protein LTS14_007970 [Recurvomyces mirabilis]